MNGNGLETDVSQIAQSKSIDRPYHRHLSSTSTNGFLNSSPVITSAGQSYLRGFITSYIAVTDCKAFEKSFKTMYQDIDSFDKGERFYFTIIMWPLGSAVLQKSKTKIPSVSSGR